MIRSSSAFCAQHSSNQSEPLHQDRIARFAANERTADQAGGARSCCSVASFGKPTGRVNMSRTGSGRMELKLGSGSGTVNGDGICCEWKMRIAIHSQLDGPSQFGTLCHELAHIYLGHLRTDREHWWPSRTDLDDRSSRVLRASLPGLPPCLQSSSNPQADANTRAGVETVVEVAEAVTQKSGAKHCHRAVNRS